MRVEDHERSGAPGVLEDVRELLNSWYIPNDRRVAQDDLGVWATNHTEWQRRFQVLSRPRTQPEVEQLAMTREAVRALVNDDATAFNVLLSSDPPQIDVSREKMRFTTRESLSSDGALMGLVLNAAVDGTLARLRTCQDCGWAFYDTSRNNRRRWCAMNPQSGGRGCGAAAKARDYRQRRHDKPTAQPGQGIG